MEDGFPMLKYKTQIIFIAGRKFRFASILKKIKSNHRTYYPSKKELDVTKLNLIKEYLNKKKAAIVTHLAALSQPMILHEKNIC